MDHVLTQAAEAMKVSVSLHQAITNSHRSPVDHFLHIFGPDPVNYYPPLGCLEICVLVNKTMDNALCSQINNTIHAYSQWVKDEYRPQKAAPSHPCGDLYKLLLPMAEELIPDLINTTKAASICEISFGAFMVTASIHILLLQELASMDPEATPSQSKHRQQIIEKAAEYSAHATDLYDRIICGRAAKVTPITENCGPSMKNSRDIVTTYTFDDLVTGWKHTESTVWLRSRGYYTKGGPSFAKYSCEMVRMSYVKSVDIRMHHLVLDPLGFIFSWRKLAQQPLPAELETH